MFTSHTNGFIVVLSGDLSLLVSARERVFVRDDTVLFFRVKFDGSEKIDLLISFKAFCSSNFYFQNSSKHFLQLGIYVKSIVSSF